MTTEQAVQMPTVAMNLPDLESLIRRVVRQEVREALTEWFAPREEPTIIEPGSPLHQDLVELLRMKQTGTLELLSHQEVWGTDDDLFS